MKKEIITTKLSYKIIRFWGKSTISFIEFFISFFAKKEHFLSEEFSWSKELVDKYPLIKKEFDSLKNTESFKDINLISEEQIPIVDFKKWYFTPLIAYGIPLEDNLKKCPETAKILKNIPHVTTAFFSHLTPGTYIKPHRGAFKGYLRCHLGIDIPEQTDLCAIRINNKLYHWENGKCLFFDDTFIHDAWNYTNKGRTVLYIDFIRPMPQPLMYVSKLLTQLISKSPFIQNAIKNLNS